MILQRCTKLEHAVAVVFEHRLFSTKDCMRPCTESMKRCVDDRRTIHTYIHTYNIYCTHCCTVYVGLAQARPNYLQNNVTYNNLL